MEPTQQSALRQLVSDYQPNEYVYGGDSFLGSVLPIQRKILKPESTFAEFVGYDDKGTPRYNVTTTPAKLGPVEKGPNILTRALGGALNLYDEITGNPRQAAQGISSALQGQMASATAGAPVYDLQTNQVSEFDPTIVPLMNAPAGLSALRSIKPGETIIGAAGTRTARGGLDMSQAARMQRANEQKYTGPWYHGSQRIDRVVEADKLNPRRATSGPMPFFTDDPAVAARYATGKRDTSMDFTDFSQAFQVSPKDLGISGKSPITVEKSWYFLSPEKKAEILRNAKRIGYENYDESTGRLVLHPQGVDGSPSGSQFDYLMKTSAKGNPLAALRDLWVDSGNLYGNEEQLQTIYKLAGYPAPISQVNAPWTEAKGVFPAALRIEKPLETSNTEELKKVVIPALKDAFKNDRSKKAALGADPWDKRIRYTPKEWVENLEKDINSGANSYVWTSIPDKVTNQLKALGYDGIFDQGGKMGGDGHTVAIPFGPTQVRSLISAKFDPAKKSSANITAGITGGAVGLSALRGVSQQNEDK